MSGLFSGRILVATMAEMGRRQTAPAIATDETKQKSIDFCLNNCCHAECKGRKCKELIAFERGEI